MAIIKAQILLSIYTPTNQENDPWHYEGTRKTKVFELKGKSEHEVNKKFLALMNRLNAEAEQSNQSRVNDDRK